jgi:DNA-directed RNA polymerase specialized sigma24 family protein
MTVQHQPAVPTEILDRLPVEEQEVLVLSSFYGLAKDEIASLLGASVGAVDTLLRRAQQDLRLLLTTRMPGARAA